MKLAGLWCYPVKSCAGIPLSRAGVGQRGILFDRQWMLVDGGGRFVTQRQHPRMALIQPRLEAGALVLEAPGREPLSVPLDPGTGRTVSVQIWQDRCDAAAVDGAADRWFSEFLGLAVRLVFLPRDRRRAVSPEFALPGDEVGFADGFPFLLIGAGSLADLGERMGTTLSVRRFRPNLLITGAPPYAEDRWARVRIGELVFRVAKPCSRCVITTVDPQTGVRDLDTLGALRRYRQRGNRVYFGQNLIHDSPGELALGDDVVVIEEKDPGA